MAMNYTTLIADKNTEGSIKYFVRHSEVPSDSILVSAQSAIYALLRVREMVKRSNGTIAEGDTTIPFPSNFVHPLLLTLRGTNKSRIDILDYEHFEQVVAEDENGDLYEGTPQRATFDGDSFYLDAAADQAYPYRLWYMQRLPVLSGSNLTNALTDSYGHILEAMCKGYAYAHRENEGESQKWFGLAKGYIEAANMLFDEWWQQTRAEAYWSR
jgi:hypothetical protein